jgi:uncharacterized membrane protein
LFYVDRFFLTHLTIQVSYVFWCSLIDNTANLKYLVVVCDAVLAVLFIMYGIFTIVDTRLTGDKRDQDVLAIEVLELFEFLTPSVCVIIWL